MRVMWVFVVVSCKLVNKRNRQPESRRRKMADELTWDYTGDESSPLLQRAASPFYRWARLFRSPYLGRWGAECADCGRGYPRTGIRRFSCGRGQSADPPNKHICGRGSSADLKPRVLFAGPTSIFGHCSRLYKKAEAMVTPRRKCRRPAIVTPKSYPYP